MGWLREMIQMALWSRRPPVVSKLDAALEKNAEAHRGVADEEAEFTYRLAEQKDKTEAMLDKIRERVKEGHKPSPALVAIAHTLKSLEQH